jgi:hypothetical protein
MHMFTAAYVCNKTSDLPKRMAAPPRYVTNSMRQKLKY